MSIASADSLGVLAFLWLLFGRGGSAPARGGGGAALPATAPETSAPGILTSTTAAPWPATLPAELPKFPSSGWEYDEPPPKAVQQRAQQLRAQLWQQGSGSHRIELTGGRWIAYRAEKVRSGKQGVVAYRVKARLPAAPGGGGAAPAAPAAPLKAGTEVEVVQGRWYRFGAILAAPAGVQPADIARGMALAGAQQITLDPGPPMTARYVQRGAATHKVLLGVPVTVKLGEHSAQFTITSVVEVPAPAAQPAAQPPAALPPAVPAPGAPNVLQLRDLKVGDGMAPAAPLEEVKIVQRRLNVTPVDGRFGDATRNAVIEFQVQTGLAPNLPRDQLRKRGFGAVKKATWEKLFAVRA